MVVGRRCGFWRGYGDWQTAILELASPLLFIWSMSWFIDLVQEGHLFDDNHLGHTVVGGAFFGFIALLSVLGILPFWSSLHDGVLDSACPCCGA